MNAKVLLFSLTLIAASLAGCADNTGGDTRGTPTPTPTPTPATPTGSSTSEPDEMMAPLDCAPATGEPTPASPVRGYPQISVTVEEPSGDDPCYQFVAVDTISAGWTAISFNNTGMSPHIMPMYRLDEGHTAKEFQTAMNAPVGPEWATPVGGVGFVTPFAAATAIVDLQEGTYVFVCPFEGHHMKGMIHELKVTPAEGEPLAAPEAELTFRAQDFSYEPMAGLQPGTYVVEFKNEGTQPHEFPLVKLNAGVSMEDFLKAIEDPNPAGPPPGSGIGGVNIVAPGRSAFAIVEFGEGGHGFVCFVGSPDHDGAPHIALGMVTQFGVGGNTAPEGNSTPTS